MSVAPGVIFSSIRSEAEKKIMISPFKTGNFLELF
jgi:hypothetical protein